MNHDIGSPTAAAGGKGVLSTEKPRLISLTSPMDRGTEKGAPRRSIEPWLMPPVELH